MRRIAPFLISLLLVLCQPALALAHGTNTGPTQTFTQAVGPYNLIVTLELPTGAPSPIFIDLLPDQEIGEVAIQLRAAPRGQSFDGRPSALVQTQAGKPAPLLTQLNLEQAGAWDLELRAEGAAGSGVATIPFTVPTPTIPVTTFVLFGAFGLIFVVLVLNISFGTRDGKPRLPAWLRQGMAYTVVSCLSVAAVLGIQQMFTPTTNSTTTALGRPHVNIELTSEPLQPQSGQPVSLTFDLTDGSTGQPVEDLETHHESLLHLVVLDETSSFFAHLHPARIGAGRFVVSLTPDRPGRYTAYAEIARQESGTQVISHDFTVAGTTVAPSPPIEGFGQRSIDGLTIDVSSSQAPLRVGKQTTLTFRFTQRGQEVQDLQPWLGMAGHLIARSADGQIFNHVHAAEPMAPAGVMLSSGTRYGPQIRFAFAFPTAGRYYLWAQFKQNDRIITVPLVVDVEE